MREEKEGQQAELDAIESGELQSVADLQGAKQQAIRAAKNSLNKTHNTSVRFSGRDVHKLKAEVTMKIILQDQGKMQSDAAERAGRGDIGDEVAFDDTPFDVPGWISIEIGGVSVAEIHINDLYPATLAFKQRYDKAMEG